MRLWHQLQHFVSSLVVQQMIEWLHFGVIDNGPRVCIGIHRRFPLLQRFPFAQFAFTAVTAHRHVVVGLHGRKPVLSLLQLCFASVGNNSRFEHRAKVLFGCISFLVAVHACYLGGIYSAANHALGDVILSESVGQRGPLRFVPHSVLQQRIQSSHKLVGVAHQTVHGEFSSGCHCTRFPNYFGRFVDVFLWFEHNTWTDFGHTCLYIGSVVAVRDERVLRKVRRLIHEDFGPTQRRDVIAPIHPVHVTELEIEQSVRRNFWCQIICAHSTSVQQLGCCASKQIQFRSVHQVANRDDLISVLVHNVLGRRGRRILEHHVNRSIFLLRRKVHRVIFSVVQEYVDWFAIKHDGVQSICVAIGKFVGFLQFEDQSLVDVHHANRKRFRLWRFAKHRLERDLRSQRLESNPFVLPFAVLLIL